MLWRKWAKPLPDPAWFGSARNGPARLGPAVLSGDRWRQLVAGGVSHVTVPGLGRPIRRPGDFTGDRDDVRSCVEHRS